MPYIPFSEINSQFVDSSGTPLVGGVLYFYYAGTSDPASVYSDVDGTTVGSSVTLNSLGYPESGGAAIVPLWRDASTSYKVILKTSAGATVWSSDYIPTVSYYDTASSDKLAGIEDNADVTDIDNVQPLIVGRENLPFIEAERFYLPTTGPCGALATTEGTAGLPNYRGLPFDGSTEEAAEILLMVPKRWDATTLAVKLVWTSAATDTDGVTWSVKARCYADGDSINSSWGTAATVDDTLGGGAGRIMVTSEMTVTPGGTVTSESPVIMRVSRTPAAAGDTATEDCTLLGALVSYVTASVNDA